MSSEIDRKSSVPLNKQMEYLIRNNINDKVWKPGEKIPSERKLCEIYGVSHITVRSALSGLVKEGLLYTTHGKGTYVSEPTVDIDYKAGVLNQLGINNKDFSYTQLLSFEKKRVEKEICDKFQCHETTVFYVYERISEINGRVFGHHVSYIPSIYVNDLKGPEVLTMHSGDILANKGYFGNNIKESLEVIEAGTRDSQLLGVKKNSPLFRLENLYQTTEGMAMYYTVITFSTKRIKLQFEAKYPGE